MLIHLWRLRRATDHRAQGFSIRSAPCSGLIQADGARAPTSWLPSAKRGLLLDALFGFLGTWLGQVLIAAGSAAFLTLAKGLTRPTSEFFVRLDDMAIGIDLLVLALVTIVSGAVAQNVAIATHVGALAEAARERQVELGFMGIPILVVLGGVAALMSRKGRLTEAEQTAWRLKWFSPRDAEKNAWYLKWFSKRFSRRRISKVNLDKLSSPPNMHPFWGVLLPDILGLVMLILAIGVVVR
jgi:hypothetical protein